MKILVADKFESAGIDGFKALGATVAYEPGVGAEKLGQALAATAPEVLVVRSTKVKADTIAMAQGLKVILRAGSGVDNIDVPAATGRGIRVCNCPGMNAVAVAELTMGLLLCCDRRLPDQTAALRAGTWNKKEFGKARGLKGLTLGVVGVGNIGQEVIRRANAFGMHTVAWSRGISPQHAAALNCEFGGEETSELYALAKRSDAITVHLPLVDSTKKLFGRAFFECMKPNSYFINTSRGGVVDEDALRWAIREKNIRAGLDVFDPQPAEPEGVFANETGKLSSVYGTHHCGASTNQAQMAVAMEAVRIVKVYQERGTVENCVNSQS